MAKLYQIMAINVGPEIQKMIYDCFFASHGRPHQSCVLLYRGEQHVR
jgi:hypothetical protein